MGRIWMPGGGGGADLDVITAGAADVLEGKVIVDQDGNPLSGTLRNLTNDTEIDHAIGNSTPVVLGDEAFVSQNTDGVTRAEIRYNGSRGVIEGNTLLGIEQGKMAAAGGLTAAKLANGQYAFGLLGTYKGLGNAPQSAVLPGYTFSTAALSNAAGTMPVQGGNTYYPSTVTQTIVPANRYVNGNINIVGDPNFVEANIKKGVWMFGKLGTCEGWFPTATDLYIRGQNQANFTRYTGATFDSGQITLKDGAVMLYAQNPVNFTGYTRLNIELYVGWFHDNTNSVFNGSISIGQYSSGVSFTNGKEAEYIFPSRNIGNYTISIDISRLQKTYSKLGIYFVYLSHESANSAIYRIWLS